MLSENNWIDFRDEVGANPALIALNRCPLLLAANDWRSAVGELLSEVDGQGRDLWYYRLTSEARHTLHQKDVVIDLLRTHPPHRDNYGSGWVDWLVSEPSQGRWVSKQDLGSRVLSTMLTGLDYELISALQTVLEPGSVKRQRERVSLLLQPNPCEYDAPWVIADLAMWSRLMGLMMPEVYAGVIPELRYLGCLGLAKMEDDSATPYFIPREDLKGLSSEERKFFVSNEMQRLALGGLRFGEALSPQSEEYPWEGKRPVSEWEAVHDLLVHYAGSAELNDIEVGWRAALLADVSAPTQSEEEKSLGSDLIR